MQEGIVYCHVRKGSGQEETVPSRVGAAPSRAHGASCPSPSCHQLPLSAECFPPAQAVGHFPRLKNSDLKPRDIYA